MTDIYTIFNLFYSTSTDKIMVIEDKDWISIRPKSDSIYFDHFTIDIIKSRKEICLTFYKHEVLDKIEVLHQIDTGIKIPLNRENFNKLKELIEQNYKLEWSYTDFLGVTRYYYKKVKL